MTAAIAAPAARSGQRAGAVEADRPQAGALPQQQVRDERDGHQRAWRSPNSCQARSSQGRPGASEPISVAAWSFSAARLGDRADEADQRGHPAGAQRQREDEQRLVAEHPP